MKNLKTTRTLYIIGIGPGHPNYLIPKAKQVINDMDFIIAGKRNQENISLNNKNVYTIKGPLDGIKNVIEETPLDKKIGILVSGDPSFYSLLNWTKRNFPMNTINVIPGISSVQYFFNQLKKSHDKSYWVSLHGRSNEFIDQINNHRYVVLLTDQHNTPNKIAEELIKNNYSNMMHIGEDLSYETERITSALPIEVVKRDDYEPSVVIIANENYTG